MLGIEIPDWLTWELAKDFAESNFVSSLFAAMAGAYGGAWAAQRLADKVKLRDELIAEVRNTNAAIYIIFGLSNSYLNLKEQHGKGLKEGYDAQKAAVVAHQAGLAEGTTAPGTQLNIGAMDFRTLSPIGINIAEVKAAVLDKLKVGGRPRAMIEVLASSGASLNDSIQGRNFLVSWHNSHEMATDIRVALVFGLPGIQGRIDTQFGDMVDAIYRQTDDCIFFAEQLCADLNTYGERVYAKYGKRGFKAEIPKVVRASFAIPAGKGLMPDKANYEGWMSGFPQKMPKTEGRWIQWSWYQMRRFGRHVAIGIRSLFEF